MFLGLAIHDTSQVIGSALTYDQVYNDEVVLKTATITKLTRNVLLAGVIPALAYSHASINREETPKFSFQLVSKSIYQALCLVSLVCLAFVAQVITAFFPMVVHLEFLMLLTGGRLLRLQEICWWALFTRNSYGGVGLNTSMSVLKEGNLGLKPFIVGSVGCAIVGLTAFDFSWNLYFYGLGLGCQKLWEGHRPDTLRELFFSF